MSGSDHNSYEDYSTEARPEWWIATMPLPAPETCLDAELAARYGGHGRPQGAWWCGRVTTELMDYIRRRLAQNDQGSQARRSEVDRAQAWLLEVIANDRRAVRDAIGCTCGDTDRMERRFYDW